VDTRKSIVASEAIKAGADIINDVSAGKYDPLMLTTVGSYDVPYIAMHMRGEPQTMMQSQYLNYSTNSIMMITEVANDLNRQLIEQINKHIPLWSQIIDPGIGFAKGYDQNIQLLKPNNLHLFRKFLNYRPLLIGLSRKKFLTKIILDTFQQRSLDANDMMKNEHPQALSSSYGSDKIEKKIDNNIISDVKTNTVTTNQSNEYHSDKLMSTSCTIESRDIATSAGCITAMLGGARILRVHNVESTRIIIDTFHSLNK